ncbi:dUTP diphosphatase [Candidatus Electronema sp. JM]|uniref:dUTP diphosphatase n=1 Tax=Candidatus Electronema sp. JM TaxID=3401571 RepID=UPI003AA929EF
MPQEVSVQFRWLLPPEQRNIPMPRYASAQAAGMDVAAACAEDVVLQPGGIELVPSSFAAALPEGFELQVRPRSGLAVKHGITVVNAPGTVDADYRGEIKIALINLGREPFTIRRGDRIAQLVLAPVCRACLHVVELLPDSERGSGGFGHTGR